jgi:hypothetical protein
VITRHLRARRRSWERPAASSVPHNQRVPVDVDFARLRPWGRGQDTAFEELSCQIARARAASRGHRFVRLGTPDGGIEGYEIDADGREHGIQAKFFLAKPTNSQWRDITSSVKRAIDKHPKLVGLTVALPADRADPRMPNEQWFMDEWDSYETTWRATAEAAGRSITFSYLGKSEIADAMSLEEHAGRYRWWFDQHLLSGRWLGDRLEEVANQVGPRYNRELTVDVPAGRHLTQFARLPGLLVELDTLATTAFDLAAGLANAGLADEQVDRLVEVVAGLPRPTSGPDRVSGPHVTPPFDLWHEAWREVSRASEILIPTYFGEDEWGNRTTTGRTVRALHDVSGQAIGLLGGNLVREGMAAAYQAPAMLLWGDAGVGKTHILCDTAAQALERGQPAIVVLGQQLAAGQPWRQILEALRFDGTAEEFLQALGARAEAAGQRALLFIDAINENNGAVLWPDHLAAFLTLARRYPWIGVVLSVRTTARSLLVPEHIGPSDLLQLEHEGFAEAPIESLIAFCDHYGLPLPSAPLALYQEMANPLLLRLYCQAATRQPGLLAHPLPGLTRVVDAVLADIDVRARRALQSDPYLEIARPVCQAIATAMRQHGRPFLTRPEATAVANAAVPSLAAAAYARTPLAVLASEGLLTEDFVIEGAPRQHVPVVRFSFERIGDHLGAQALLHEVVPHGSASPDHILDVLADTLASSGGSTTDNSASYRLRSALEALAVLLPERIRRELADLISVLQSKIGPAQLSMIGGATRGWLTSLTLREPSAFTDATRTRLGELVVGAVDAAAFPLSESRRAAIRTVLALAVHPDQPLGPGWLHSLLAPLVMAERDRRWTSQIRGTREAETPYSTLIFWCRSAPRELLVTPVGGGRSFARLAAAALMWALPSPDRFLRDTATRALVAMADHDHAVVADLLDAAGEVDDCYIVERVLAVACAAALRGRADSRALAADLRQFVGRRGLPADVLARDYLAVSVGALAARLGEDEDFVALSELALPPYPPEWPGPVGQPSLADLKGTYPPIPPGMDLNQPAAADPDEREAERRRLVSGGYISVTSSLDDMGDFHTYIMHVDRPYAFRFVRQRLDEPHDATPLEDFDLAVLPGWVFARVLDLGWSPQVFGEVDVDIDSENSGSTAHKRERFGKKYQWLAWHEALARLSGTQRFRQELDRELDTAFQGAWQLDFVRDMDPSHLCDLPVPDQRQRWRALWRAGPLTLDATVAADVSNDGPVVLTHPTERGERQPIWWFPVSELPQPAVPPSGDPVEALSTWAIDGGELPDLSPYLVVRGDLDAWVRDGRVDQPTPGPRYLLLTHTQHLLERPDERVYPYADLLISVDSVLIRADDLPALQAWAGTEPLDGFALDVSITDAIFLGEWPDAAAYLTNCSPDFRPRTWQEAIGTNATGLGVPAVVMTERYCWEGSTRDCSLADTLNIYLLTPAAAALFPGLRQLDGVGRTANGTLVHLDPHPAPNAAGTVLVDEALLADALTREGLVLLQIIQQSKRVVTRSGDHRFAGETLSTRLVGTVGEETLCDITRQRVLPPRLH